MKKFCICSCFYTNNYFLRAFNLHVQYHSKDLFMSQYSEILQSKGCTDLNEVVKELEGELSRRKEKVLNTYTRTKEIKERYVPLHPSIFTLSVNSFDTRFLELLDTVKQSKDINSLITEKTLFKTWSPHIYSVPFFKHNFCSKLVEEIKNFESSDLPKFRPNTMNRYGIDLNELGFDQFVTDLREQYIAPFTTLLYPECGGDSLDSHKAFIVKYKEGDDVDLSYHFDNAEVTLNVSLNDDYDEGDLYFGPMRGDNSSVRTGYSHQLGHGLLHRGQQMHGALPITEGERYNMIIWMRSSKVRNYLCPMCNDVPTLIPVDYGYGDGFTQVHENVCTAQ